MYMYMDAYRKQGFAYQHSIINTVKDPHQYQVTMLLLQEDTVYVALIKQIIKKNIIL